MAAKYWATSVNGGVSGAMDAIDPTDTDGSATALVVVDKCEVIEETIISIYEAKSTASMTESFPDVILPDTNPGNWWWDLINRKPRDEGMVAALVYANTPGAF